MATLQELATEAAGWFEGATRDNGETYRRLKDGRPEWVYELVREAHGEMFPDDWRYSAIEDALERLAEEDEDDARDSFTDRAVDVYTGARLKWLASDLRRPGYCDDAVEELGAYEGGLVGLVGLGQYYEAGELFGLVLQALEQRLDELHDDEAWTAGDTPAEEQD